MPALSLNPTFKKLWQASALSNLGDGIARPAFPLLAALLTRDPALVAGFTVALSLPWLLFSLHAGALIDRWDRKRVLVWAAALRMLLAALSLVIFIDAISLNLLYVVAFLFGSIEVFFDNASTTVLPAVVERGDLLARQFGLSAPYWLGGIVIFLTLLLALRTTNNHTLGIAREVNPA
jgi:MFS family permease